MRFAAVTAATIVTGILAAFVSAAAAAAAAAAAPPPQPASGPTLDLKTVDALPVRKGDAQVLKLVGTFADGGLPKAEVDVDGAIVGELKPVDGKLDAEFALPAVGKETRSTLRVRSGDAVLATREFVRRPVRELIIYITPHSHVDIGYTQLQPEIEAKQVSNLLTALDLIEKSRGNPPGSQYRWTVEAAWTIDNLLARQPEKVPAVVEALKAGRVELDGSFANLLTGLCRPEELIRAYARGSEYGRRFDVPVETAMISDVPGYTWGTTTALAAAGIKYFSIAPNFMDRIGTTMTAWQDKPFYWQTPDAKHRILCWVPFTGYAWSHIAKTISRDHVVELVRHLEQIGYPYELTYIRWSGHGDNAVPDPALVDSVKAWNEKYTWPKLVIATISKPFQELESRYARRIPTVRGDWTPYWEDGAASSALETAMNRATGERLVTAETLWASLRSATEFPANDFRAAWRGAMLYSEHTWGAHCSVSEPSNPLTTGQWKYKRGYAVDADAVSRKLLDESVASGAAVANAVDVFNPSPWKRSQVILISKDLSAAGDRVTDPAGRPVDSQRLGSGELAVRADVPAFGFARFFTSAGSGPATDRGGSASDRIDNGLLNVHVDPITGAIDKLVREAFDYVDEKSGGLNEYLYVAADRFDAPKRAGTPQINVRDSGPLVWSIVITSSAPPGCAMLTRELRLVRGDDHLEISDTLDKLRAEVKERGNPQDPNNAKEAVHFAFPFNVPGGQIRMDVPWAVVTPEKDQMPGACKNWFTVQRWVDISNTERGVTWSPIDAPMVQVGGITATLIGSQTNPDVWQKHVDPHATSLYSWAMNNYWHTNYRAYQEGVTTFRYRIRPHGPPSLAEAQRFGIEQSQPFIVVPARDRKPAVAGAPRPKIDSPDVLLTAFKPADDGKGYILRLFAGAGRDVDVLLEWEGKAPAAVYRSDTLESRGGEKVSRPIHLAPWEVLTLRAE